MAPLLARPGSTSERWHVLSDPNNASTTGDPRLSGDAAGTSPPSSAGTILLSLGFTPTGGTPIIRPLPATPLVVGSSNRTPRHASSESPAGSSKSNFGWGGGDNGMRTPRAETPAIPEGFSLGEAAMPGGGGGGGAGTSSSGAAERADTLSSTQRVVDAQAASSALSRDGDVGGGEALDDAERDGGKGGLLLPEEAAGETPDERRGVVEVDTGSGAVLEVNGTQDQEPGKGKVHLFRVKTYSAPVWCEICEGFLLGVGGGLERGGGSLVTRRMFFSRRELDEIASLFMKARERRIAGESICSHLPCSCPRQDSLRYIGKIGMCSTLLAGILSFPVPS